ncbi:MAG: hypothetical protein OEZ54_10370 [Gemmatimonadota bacterium]|nr:hypothetical protein [Gemmatimonadota bacterium]
MSESKALYQSRENAGAALARLVYQRASRPFLVWGVAASGVEVGAAAAKAMQASFDVVVGSNIRMNENQVVGAMAEDCDALLDPDFAPQFSEVENVESAIDRSRRAIKQERMLFRGHRPLRPVAGAHVVIVDGNLTSPWRVLAAASCAEKMGATSVMIAAAVSTQPVKDKLRARRMELICPAVTFEPAGHARPFADHQDENAERLRSIVVARDAA